MNFPFSQTHRACSLPALKRFGYQPQLVSKHTSLHSAPKSMAFVNSAACHKPSPLRFAIPLGKSSQDLNDSTPYALSAPSGPASHLSFDSFPAQSPASTPGPGTPSVEYLGFEDISTFHPSPASKFQNHDEAPLFHSWEAFLQTSLLNDTYGQCTLGAESARRRRHASKPNSPRVAIQGDSYTSDPVEEIFTLYATTEDYGSVDQIISYGPQSASTPVSDDNTPGENSEPVFDYTLFCGFSHHSMDDESVRRMYGGNAALRGVKRISQTIKSSLKGLARRYSS